VHRVASLLLLSGFVGGCIIDRSALTGGDAHVEPGIDAAVDPPDAPAVDAHGADAWGPDAWAADAPTSDAGVDAWTPDAWGADAWAPDAWAPDAWAPDAGACAGPRCEGNVLVECSPARMTTCDACGTSPGMMTPHCLALVPSNTPPGYAVPTDPSAVEVVFDGTPLEWECIPLA